MYSCVHILRKFYSYPSMAFAIILCTFKGLFFFHFFLRVSWYSLHNIFPNASKKKLLFTLQEFAIFHSQEEKWTMKTFSSGFFCFVLHLSSKKRCSLFSAKRTLHLSETIEISKCGTLMVVKFVFKGAVIMTGFFFFCIHWRSYYDVLHYPSL